MNGKCSGDEIDEAALNCFKSIRERMVDSTWRLEMDYGEMTDDVILIFETTL